MQPTYEALIMVRLLRLEERMDQMTVDFTQLQNAEEAAVTLLKDTHMQLVELRDQMSANPNTDAASQAIVDKMTADLRAGMASVADMPSAATPSTDTTNNATIADGSASVTGASLTGATNPVVQGPTTVAAPGVSATGAAMTQPASQVADVTPSTAAPVSPSPTSGQPSA